MIFNIHTDIRIRLYWSYLVYTYVLMMFNICIDDIWHFCTDYIQHPYWLIDICIDIRYQYEWK